jgi:hypothetical protein
MILTFPELRYLDDRPVPEIDRISAEGWREGGREGELAARRHYLEEREAWDKAQMKAFMKPAHEHERRRREYLEKAEAER